jgi:hypothetical protein
VRILIIIFISAAICGISPMALADGENESSAKPFFSSCFYGTVAGTLVGAATLAFTSNPGDNLSNIARGASLGLYGGIILGLYLTYGVGDSQESAGSLPTQSRSQIKKEYKVSVAPVINTSTLGANLKVNF